MDAAPPRARVIADNDFAGDPDGLFQLAHHLLSPSVELRAVVSSRLRPGDPFHPGEGSATAGARRATELLRVMGMEGRLPVLEGRSSGFASALPSTGAEGVRAIVAEAMREDTELPLFLCCGGGLTDLASALSAEPRIAGRLTAIWIGGPEYPGSAPPPGSAGLEYNLAIDLEAARYVFGESEVPLWQVPRNSYRRALASLAELASRLGPSGPLGAFLTGALEEVRGLFAGPGAGLGEAYVLGDSPLVLLTALLSPFEPDASSSEYILRDRPAIEADGSYGPPSGRGPIRVYDRLDLRLLFEDFFAKVDRFAGREAGSRG